MMGKQRGKRSAAATLRRETRGAVKDREREIKAIRAELRVKLEDGAAAATAASSHERGSSTGTGAGGGSTAADAAGNASAHAAAADVDAAGRCHVKRERSLDPASGSD